MLVVPILIAFHLFEYCRILFAKPLLGIITHVTASESSNGKAVRYFKRSIEVRETETGEKKTTIVGGSLKPALKGVTGSPETCARNSHDYGSTSNDSPKHHVKSVSWATPLYQSAESSTSRKQKSKNPWNLWCFFTS
ncbi:hypothetical protein PGT21_006712 [Puccinia graminis f. sp. tritici]|uniref:Uncharacterized protein n=1 Tax=Puccinia graminis f. sp. tritici TaxID=56615 RepID=A0A5B0Q4V3_PUCGR|nr:hypothetical protein PGT21_006712 [Puccinia graminis f. sp. tritici]